MQGSELTQKQLKAVAALLANPTLKEAAAECKVNEATIWRWMQEPAFQRAYRAARRQVVEHSIGELQAATSEAVAALRRNLRCPLSPGVEVRAAQIILEQSIKAIELTDMEERLSALEASLQPQQKGLRRA